VSKQKAKFAEEPTTLTMAVSPTTRKLRMVPRPCKHVLQHKYDTYGFAVLPRRAIWSKSGNAKIQVH